MTNPRLHKHLTVAAIWLLPFMFLALPAQSADTGDILVNIKGIKAEQAGQLIIALFDEKGSWPKHDSAVQRVKVPVSGPTAEIPLKVVAANKPYAVQVLHDKNSNDKLDMRWFPYPKPKEGVGVSNNNSRIGPPSFEKARFTTAGTETVISITLAY